MCVCVCVCVWECVCSQYLKTVTDNLELGSCHRLPGLCRLHFRRALCRSSFTLVGKTASWGLPRWLRGQDSTCQCGSRRRRGFDPWVGKTPWRRTWPPTPVFLPGEFHGQRSLAGYSPWGRRESDMTEQTGTQDCLFVLRRESFRGRTFQIQHLMTRNRYNNPCPFW